MDTLLHSFILNTDDDSISAITEELTNQVRQRLDSDTTKEEFDSYVDELRVINLMSGIFRSWKNTEIDRVEKLKVETDVGIDDTNEVEETN